MGTISKIVESLIAQRDDKIVKLNTRFDEHSSWLAKELEQVRQLVNQNPRDNLKSKGVITTTASSSSSSTVVRSEPPSAPANDELALPPVPVVISKESSTESSISESSAANIKRQKRKSPETALVKDIGASPELKRTSIDFEHLAISAGLPTDLNRLKKEQLLAELEARGETSLSMKSLKKELIDALKTALENEAQSKAMPLTFTSTASVDIAVSSHLMAGSDECGESEVAETGTVEEEDDVQSMIMASPAPASSPPLISSPVPMAKISTPSPAVKSPIRKGSLLLSTYRTNLAAAAATAATAASPLPPVQPTTDIDSRVHEASIDEAPRTKDEFERRTKDSAMRKSIAATATGAIVPASDALPETALVSEVQEPIEQVATITMPIATAAAKPSKTGASSSMGGMPMAASNPNSAESSNSTDIRPKTSPALLIPSLAAMMISPDKDMDDDDEVENVVQSNTSNDHSNPLTPPPMAADTGVWSDVASPVPAPASHPTAAVAVETKRPMNMVASLTSLVPDLAPKEAPKVKAVVPALEKAKQLKASEDAKAAAKKREMELKQKILAEKKAATAGVLAGLAAPVVKAALAWDSIVKPVAKTTTAAAQPSSGISQAATSVPLSAATVTAPVVAKLASNAASFDISVTADTKETPAQTSASTTAASTAASTAVPITNLLTTQIPAGINPSTSAIAASMSAPLPAPSPAPSSVRKIGGLFSFMSAKKTRSEDEHVPQSIVKPLPAFQAAATAVKPAPTTPTRGVVVATHAEGTTQVSGVAATILSITPPPAEAPPPVPVQSVPMPPIVPTVAAPAMDVPIASKAANGTPNPKPQAIAITPTTPSVKVALSPTASGNQGQGVSPAREDDEGYVMDDR